MQRIIGGILILASTGGAGYIYGKELKIYLNNMIYFRYVMSLIKGEIAYTQAPLYEIFIEVAGKIKQPYRGWLLKISEEIENREENGFCRIWGRCTDRHLKELDFRNEHLILIKEAGTFLGNLRSETLDQAFQMYLNRIDYEVEKLRGNLSEKTKIGGCLGIMSGIFLIVILL